MLSFLLGKSRSQGIPNQLYGGLMTQSRQPALYRDYGVPDTVMGRFDMLALHTYLFARRLKAEKQDITDSLNQDVFDLFVADVERALRELGIGDTTVPKRKKKMIRSFYGQIDDFDQPMDANDMSKLIEKVDKRYFSDVTNEQVSDPAALAQYMLRQEENLSKFTGKEILRGKVTWVN